MTMHKSFADAMNALSIQRVREQIEQERQVEELRETRTRDQSGRVISTFEGHPMTWMNQFSSPSRRLVGIKTRRSNA